MSLRVPHGTLFGNSLETLPRVEFSGCGVIPQFLAAALDALSHHTDAEGLFRKSGSLTRQRELREALERREPVDLSASELVHDTAALLKQFLRELPEPLLSAHLQDAFLKAASAAESCASDAVLLVSSLLPPLQLACVRALVRFLRRVHLNARVNRMDATNLAVLLAPNLFPNQKPVAATSPASAETTPPAGAFAGAPVVSTPSTATATVQPMLRAVRAATKRPAASRAPLLPNAQLDLLPTRRPASMLLPESHEEQLNQLSYTICAETSTMRLQARVLELLILRADEVGLVPADVQIRFSALVQHPSPSEALVAPVFTAAEVNANSTLTSFEPNCSFTSTCEPLDAGADLHASQLSLCAPPPFESTRLDVFESSTSLHRVANPPGALKSAPLAPATDPNAVSAFTLPAQYEKASRRSFGAYFTRRNSSHSKSKKRVSIASSENQRNANDDVASPVKKKRRSIQGLLIEFGHTISKSIRRASLGRLKEKAVAEPDFGAAPADAVKEACPFTRQTLQATRRPLSLHSLNVNVFTERAEFVQVRAPPPQREVDERLALASLPRQPIATTRLPQHPAPTSNLAGPLKAPLANPERISTTPRRLPAALSASARGCVVPLLQPTARGTAAQADARLHQQQQQQQALAQGPRVGPLEVLPSRCRFSLLTEPLALQVSH